MKPRPNTSAAKKKVGEQVFEGLAVQEPNCAGIDIGSETHYVSVPEHHQPALRTFGCLTPDLLEMAAWLKACGIRSVVMESTGVYWMPVYQVLEDAGFSVHLVDAQHAKHVPGRKTDVWDCCWLRKLFTYGLLKSCFVPPADVCELRAYWRHRNTLIEGCSTQVLRMQKALEQMNLQLHKVLSDITGVSGMKILRALVGGERDPHTLAALRHEKVQASQEKIVAALTGHYRPEHLFVLEQALCTYDFVHQQIKACDQKIEAALQRFRDTDPPEGGQDPPQQDALPPRTRRRKNEPYMDLRPYLGRIFGVDLLKIDGISTLTAMTLLTEYGPDLTRFEDVGHFTSSLHLCPNHKITGGKIRCRRTRRGKNRTATALCLAAQSLHRSKSALGAYLRRMRGKIGAPKAITATAHKLARMIYYMLTRGQTYVDVGQEVYEQQYEQRRLKQLLKQAHSLGLSLVCTATGEVVS